MNIVVFEKAVVKPIGLVVDKQTTALPSVTIGVEVQSLEVGSA